MGIKLLTRNTHVGVLVTLQCSVQHHRELSPPAWLTGKSHNTGMHPTSACVCCNRTERHGKMENSPALLWSSSDGPSMLPVLSQRCNSRWVHCVEQENTPGNPWASPAAKNRALKSVQWLEMSVPVCVPQPPTGQGRKANAQECTCKGACRVEQGDNHSLATDSLSLHPGFICSTSAPQMLLSCMQYSAKIFSISSFFLRNFPCFPCHVVPAAALTLPTHCSPSWKENLCTQKINRNQYQQLSFSINTVTRK